ncbi:acyl-CoA dehydrogenase family protein [Halioxenophilus aromaticivorans]|uniref:3-sulfinopropanoyl-CoA desulfinase n=1 Tax=Halioxenophilus aromaticivorans TaxID=1306992 RepID=A0AAV3TYJ7_9ALTE
MNKKRLSEMLYSDVFLPEETLAIRAQARAFADRVLQPIAHEVNTTVEDPKNFRRDIVNALAEAGLYQVSFSKDVGGRGLNYPMLATLTVMEELGYYTPGIASALFDGQAILCGQTLDKAQDEIRSRWLPKLIRGEIVCCFATSEPEASTDLSVSAMATMAIRDGDGYRVTGKKRWITNSVAGDIMLTLVRTGDNLTMLLIDMHSEGVTVGAPDKKMGNHAQMTADVTLNDVWVPRSHVIGSVGGGLRAALAALTMGRAGIAALGVGMAQRAFDHSVEYISGRHCFGQPIAGFQHWQFKYADRATAIENARNLYIKAALNADKKCSPQPLMAMAKIVGSEVAVDMSRDAIQACGGYGFVRRLEGAGQDWPLESIYRDAKIGEIYEGANEVQRWAIAREIFGRDITG